MATAPLIFLWQDGAAATANPVIHFRVGSIPPESPPGFVGPTRFPFPYVPPQPPAANPFVPFRVGSLLSESPPAFVGPAWFPFPYVPPPPAPANPVIPFRIGLAPVLEPEPLNTTRILPFPFVSEAPFRAFIPFVVGRYIQRESEFAGGVSRSFVFGVPAAPAPANPVIAFVVVRIPNPIETRFAIPQFTPFPFRSEAVAPTGNQTMVFHHHHTHGSH